MAEHTPLPWDYVPSTEHHGPYITSDHGGTIADLYLMSQPGALSTRNGGASKPVHFFHEMADPNAVLIVRAVNSHDALVKCVQEMLRVYWADGDGELPEPECIRNARAALALCEQNEAAALPTGEAG